MKIPGVVSARLGVERSPLWLALAASLFFAFLLWQYEHRLSVQEQRVEFDSRVGDIGDRIQRRIQYYEQVLRGVRGFYLHQREMEPQEFSGYVAALELEKNFPGLQGVSYAPLVSDANRAAHIRLMRRYGFANYTITPSGQRPFYAPVAYIEPLDARNMRVFGFDNLSNPIRRKIIEQARDEDRAVISEKLLLKQESDQSTRSGFLMFLPAFRHGTAHDTLAARRANIDGWFGASFNLDSLIAGALDGRARGIGIEIFDGGAISAQSRMYASSAGRGTASAFDKVMAIEIAGRKWLLRFTSLPEFEAQRDKLGERNALIAGIALCLLVPLIVWLLLRDRRRELQMSSAIGHESEKRKLAEYRTQELHMLNEAILERSPSGIALFMANGPCVMANEAYAKAIGGATEDVLKQDFRINASWKRNGLLDFADQAIDTGLTIRRDIKGMTSFGKEVMVECIFAPITVSGRPHLLLIVNDISERVAAERALTETMHQLEEKELAKTRFLAAAGHDLRQPVAAANLFIDALKLTAPNARQQEIIQRLDMSMATFYGLLEALLNISKLDAGMIKPEYSTFHVVEVFNWLEQNFAPMAGEKRLGFRLHFPLREMLLVRSDIGLVKSVLMNLVSNALKFTARGAVMVSARKRGAMVLFQVWDTGIGISQEHIGHIFDEFYQINNPQRDRTSGLGLGLSIVKRALSLLGTRIACHSRSGHGSVFEFQLPLEGDAHGHAPLAAETQNLPDVADESFARGKRFVVVEDDALVAQATINWLEGMGAEAVCFHSAEEALRHAHTDFADCYIADYMLGGTLNGIQFLNMVRHKLGKPINAVLVTGDTSANFIRHAVDCDWPVLHKPINTSRLIAMLGAQSRGAAPK